MFLFERILERLANSNYQKNFILKGGLLISSMIGISERTTNGPMAQNACKEFELSDYCGRWLECLKNRVPVKIPDVEEIRVENPEEYKLYQRLGVQSILLRLLNHAIGSALNELSHLILVDMKLLVIF